MPTNQNPAPTTDTTEVAAEVVRLLTTAKYQGRTMNGDCEDLAAAIVAKVRTHDEAHGGWRPVQPQLELLKLSVWIRDNSGLQDTGTLAGAKLMAQAFMYAFAAGQFTPSPKSGG